MVVCAVLTSPLRPTDLADLADGLGTLITWTLHNGQGGGGRIGRTEKTTKLSDLVDFGKGKILPCVVFPDKKLCMQTAIVE
jgi:hypothetical protein